MKNIPSPLRRLFGAIKSNFERMKFNRKRKSFYKTLSAISDPSNHPDFDNYFDFSYSDDMSKYPDYYIDAYALYDSYFEPLDIRFSFKMDKKYPVTAIMLKTKAFTRPTHLNVVPNEASEILHEEFEKVFPGCNNLSEKISARRGQDRPIRFIAKIILKDNIPDGNEDDISEYIESVYNTILLVCVTAYRRCMKKQIRLCGTKCTRMMGKNYINNLIGEIRKRNIYEIPNLYGIPLH